MKETFVQNPPPTLEPNVSYYDSLMANLRALQSTSSSSSEANEQGVSLCLTQTKEQIQGQLGKVCEFLDQTREALREMREIRTIKEELRREFGISLPQENV